MAKIYRIKLTTEEREALQTLIAQRSSKSLQVKRAYMLLACDENGDKIWKDERIKECYGVNVRTVERLRQRFVEGGVELTLNGKKREVFKEKVLDGSVEAKLIALRCSKPPVGYNKWTLRLLADKMVSLEYVSHISHESVRQILKKTRLSLGR